MNADERLAFEGDVDVELGKVWHVLDDGQRTHREVLVELLAGVARTRGGPLVLLEVGDALGDLMVAALPTDGPAH